MKNRISNPKPEENPMIFAAPQPVLRTRKENLSHAKKLLAQNEVSEAIDIIESLCKTKNQLLLLDRIKLQQQLNEEDLFFTRKDENMLVKRSQEVVTALLDILEGFE
jgi:adenylylsulfate kinase-like enzyme